MADKPAQPAEGTLLQRALIRARLSARAAADKAGISEGRWRQIVNGYQSARGNHIPVRAPAATLAHMARALDVTPDELVEAGRADAADVLRDLIQNSGPHTVAHTTGGAETFHNVVKLQGVRAESREVARNGIGFNPDDEALVKVMRSNLPDDKKSQLVQLLITERVEAERRRIEHAEQMIELLGGDPGQ